MASIGAKESSNPVHNRVFGKIFRNSIHPCRREFASVLLCSESRRWEVPVARRKTTPGTPLFRPLFEFFRAKRWDKTKERACTIAALDRTEKNAPIPQKEFAKSDKPIVRSGVSIPEQCPTKTLRILVCGCAPSARTLVSYPSLAPQGSLSTNAKKVTVSVLYWYEKLSILQRMKFLKRF